MKNGTKLLIITILAIAFLSCNKQSTPTSQINEIPTIAITKPIQLNKADFLTKIINYEANSEEWIYLGDKPAIIDFYANWCGPCKMIAPILEELAEEYSGKIYIYKIDIDREKELAMAFGIQRIPLLLFIPLNEDPIVVQSAIPKDIFIKAIDEILLK